MSPNVGSDLVHEIADVKVDGEGERKVVRGVDGEPALDACALHLKAPGGRPVVLSVTDAGKLRLAPGTDNLDDRLRELAIECMIDGTKQPHIKLDESHGGYDVRASRASTAFLKRPSGLAK